MPGIDGGTLRAWRRSRGWDVPEVARQLRHAARESAVHVAAHAGLIRMIYAEGVRILLGPGGFEPHAPRTGGDLVGGYPWHLGLDEAERLLSSATHRP